MYNPFESKKNPIGKVIKIIAFITWVIEVISGIITGIGIMFATYDYMWVGIIVIALSPFFASLSTILLYAFGALIDKIYDMRNDTAKIAGKVGDIEKILGTHFGIEVEECGAKEEEIPVQKPTPAPEEKTFSKPTPTPEVKTAPKPTPTPTPKQRKALVNFYKEVNGTTIECCKCHYWQSKDNDTCIKCGSKLIWKL